jgi:hypothetical protein
MTLDNYRSLMGDEPILFDIKGMLKDRDMTGIHYWSL